MLKICYYILYEFSKESELSELKENLKKLDIGIRSIYVILNRHKEAFVYFGVKDNGDINGLLLGMDIDYIPFSKMCDF